MNPKKIVTGVLMAFVALSVVYLIVKETRTTDPAASVGTSTNTAQGESVNIAEKANTVVAYYFHGNVRCQTCRKIEAYTAESITNSFKDELLAGQLQWKIVNVDETANEHFVKDYELTSRSVVLVQMVDGKQSRWKNLAQIWDLVGDKEKFQKYISDETTGFLAGGKM
jgi:hypothetical protein